MTEGEDAGMELPGRPFAAVVTVVALAAPVAVLLLWGRVRGGGVLRTAQRLGLVVWCQLSAVLVTAVLVNNQFDLYESWDDLLGGGDNGQNAQVQADHAEAASSRPASATGAGGEPFRPAAGSGAHDTRDFAKMMPETLAWLSAHLAHPVSIP